MRGRTRTTAWLSALVLVGMTCAEVQAAEYFVATNGLDGNPGTFAEPFLTIQRASSNLVAGDTLSIRGGTYREYVTPVNSGTPGSPIKYQAYNGESVTISGADAITGAWSVYSNNIFKINVGSLRFDQLFVDGQMQLKAQWPDNPGMEPVVNTSWMARIESSSNSSSLISTPVLPAGDWTGAKIWILPGNNWVGFHRTVTSYTAAQKRLGFSALSIAPVAYTVYHVQNYYYLFDSLLALSRSGEWYLDKSTGDLYLWTLAGDSPGNHTVEFRKAAVSAPGSSTLLNTPVLNIASSKSCIEFDGIDFFSGEVWLRGASCTVKNGRIKYPEYFENANGYSVRSAPVDMNGNNNRLERMEVSYGSGSGVRLAGTSNEVAYCTIHDVDWSGGEYGAVSYGDRNKIANRALYVHHNTMYRMGRSGVKGDYTDGLRFEYNEVRDAGFICRDLGLLYADESGAIYGNPSVIAYNVFKDIRASYGAGVYFDTYGDQRAGQDYICHHNVIIACGIGSIAKSINYNATNAVNNKYYNNVFYSNPSGSIRMFKSDGETGNAGGIEVRNNIIPDGIVSYVSYSAGHNFESGDPLFSDPTNGNFRLQSDSPCIDTGTNIPPYTDGYVGLAPDRGAYEFGGVDWAAGAEAVTPPLPPTNLVATAVSAGRIDLRWTDVSTNETGFKIERKPAGGSYGEIARPAANATNYSDAGVLGNRQYFYRMRASNAGGDSGYSDEANATTPPDNEAPSVPGNLTVTEVTDRSVSLAWTASTDNVGVASYRILESGSVVGSNTVASFTHSGLTPNTPYSYTVQAGDAAGNWSDASTPPVGATTLESLPFPTNGLIAYYPLDAGSGTTAIDTINGYNGTFGGSATPAWVAGKVGDGALYIDITSFTAPGRVTISAAAIKNLAASDGYTISAWAKPIVIPSVNYCGHVKVIGQTYNSDLAGNFVGFNSAGKFDVRHTWEYPVNTLGYANAVAPIASALNEWCHVVGVVSRTDGTVKLYTNGVLAATTTYGTSYGSRPAEDTLLANDWNMGAWTGNRDNGSSQQIEIDEVRLYDRALNAAEVMALAGIASPDTQAPTLSVVTPANLSYTTNSQVAVTGTAADASGVASVTVNGVGASTANGFTNWNRTVTGLAVGTNVVAVIATDNAQNAATARVSVIYAAGAFDGNGDGIPDAWQVARFGTSFTTNSDAGRDADPDRDGMRNWEEWVTGTDPNDAASRFAITDSRWSNDGTSFTVFWPSVSGGVYAVRFSTNLPVWVDVLPSVTATSSVAAWTDDGTWTGESPGVAGRRFYGVRMTP